MRQQGKPQPPGSEYVAWYDSAAEFADSCNAITGECRDRVREDREWIGNASFAEAQRFCTSGSTRNLEHAEALLGKVDAEIPTPHRLMGRVVAGGFPVVPEALSGRPDCMRRRVYESSATVPIRVFVDLVSSGGIDSEDLVKRGAAIACLVSKLATVRPVELWACSLTGNSSGWDGAKLGAYAIAVHVGHTPLALSMLMGMLAEPAVVRGLAYSHACFWGGSRPSHIRWAWGLHPTGGKEKEYEQNARRLLGIEPTDLFVPPIHLHDELQTDPVGFVQRTVARFTTEPQD